MLDPRPGPSNSQPQTLQGQPTSSFPPGLKVDPRQALGYPSFDSLAGLSSDGGVQRPPTPPPVPLQCPKTYTYSQHPTLGFVLSQSVMLPASLQLPYQGRSPPTCTFHAQQAGTPTPDPAQAHPFMPIRYSSVDTGADGTSM